MRSEAMLGNLVLKKLWDFIQKVRLDTKYSNFSITEIEILCEVVGILKKLTELDIK